jgi:adenylate cyclase
MTEIAALEQTLLGGPRRYTRGEVAAAAGMPLDEARRLWRAMGFADVGDDDVLFTDGDIAALRMVAELDREGLSDPALRVSMTRLIGQLTARLAEAQLETIGAFLGREPSELDVTAAVDVAGRILPVVERLIVYVWRRQLAAAAGRLLAASPEELSAMLLTVGFVDLVGFTRLSRQLDEVALGHLVEQFEALANDHVADSGGRIIKTLGDEVLFVADEPAAGADIALGILHGLESAESGLPSGRGGLACGLVLSRLGDVYGSPVNLASRLTSLARPGTVLVDRELAEALRGDPRFVLRRMRRRAVSGFEHLAPTLLRRATT